MPSYHAERLEVDATGAIWIQRYTITETFNPTTDRYETKQEDVERLPLYDGGGDKHRQQLAIGSEVVWLGVAGIHLRVVGVAPSGTVIYLEGEWRLRRYSANPHECATIRHSFTWTCLRTPGFTGMLDPALSRRFQDRLRAKLVRTVDADKRKRRIERYHSHYSWAFPTCYITGSLGTEVDPLVEALVLSDPARIGSALHWRNVLRSLVSTCDICENNLTEGTYREIPLRRSRVLPTQQTCVCRECMPRFREDRSAGVWVRADVLEAPRRPGPYIDYSRRVEEDLDPIGELGGILIGLEVEGETQDINTLSKDLEKAGLALCKTDSSIRSQRGAPVEVVTPPIQANREVYENAIRKLCEIMHRCGWDDNSSCGVHVHVSLDAVQTVPVGNAPRISRRNGVRVVRSRNAGMGNIARLVSAIGSDTKNQELWNAIFGRSENEYCLRTTDSRYNYNFSTPTSALRVRDANRHLAINPRTHHNTVEYRAFAHCKADPDTLIAYVEIALALSAWSKSNTTGKTALDFAKWLGADSAANAYAKDVADAKARKARKLRHVSRGGMQQADIQSAILKSRVRKDQYAYATARVASAMLSTRLASAKREEGDARARKPIGEILARQTALKEELDTIFRETTQATASKVNAAYRRLRAIYAELGIEREDFRSVSAEHGRYTLVRDSAPPPAAPAPLRDRFTVPNSDTFQEAAQTWLVD